MTTEKVVDDRNGNGMTTRKFLSLVAFAWRVLNALQREHGMINPTETAPFFL
jgi:hypothetical protein